MNQVLKRWDSYQSPEVNCIEAIAKVYLPQSRHFAENQVLRSPRQSSLRVAGGGFGPDFSSAFLLSASESSTAQRKCAISMETSIHHRESGRTCLNLARYKIKTEKVCKWSTSTLFYNVRQQDVRNCSNIPTNVRRGEIQWLT